MLDYSTERLIRGAKLRTMAPDNQFRFTDEEYASLIDDELQTRLVPLIMSVRENYYLTDQTYTIINNPTVLGFGDDNFGLLPFGSPIPISTSDLLSRAIGLITKDIWNIDSNGEFQYGISQLSFQDIKNNITAAGYYFANSKIVFHPIKAFKDKIIKVFYFRKPNQLVKSEKCAKVVFSNTTNKTLEVDTVPSDWGVGTLLDIISGKQGFDSKADSIVIDQIVGNVITVSNVPNDINAGDIVSPQGQSCVAQIPINAYPLLEQLGAIKILESLKDTEGMQNAMIQYDRLEKGFIGIISNRSQSNLKKISGFGIWK